MEPSTINQFYNDQLGDNLSFTPWLLSYHAPYQIVQFIRTRVLTEKSNWKCKFCKEKIVDGKQIQTCESHLPVYHIKCYMEMYESVFQQLNRHKSLLEQQIESIKI